jgi:hypothetical protein
MMAKNERTSSRVASQAGRVLQNPHSTPLQKRIAASALTQTKDKKK